MRDAGHAQIGVMYGNPEVTSGGNALKFYASVRLEVRRKQTIEGAKGENVGIRVKAKVNTLCLGFRFRVQGVTKECAPFKGAVAGTCTKTEVLDIAG